MTARTQETHRSITRGELVAFRPSQTCHIDVEKTMSKLAGRTSIVVGAEIAANYWQLIDAYGSAARRILRKAA